MKNTMALQDVLQSTLGQLISTKTVESFQGVGTDTRKSLTGQLFVALEGEAFDAHNFLKEATQAGATGLLIHRWDPQFESLKNEICVILVENTLTALQRLSTLRRHQWGKNLIAITGSNGKTTTKEFCAQILSQYRNTHYNKGSFNNHWGLPLTLLELQPEHDWAICEMGMNHSGEITQLISIAEPNIVGVTMVGRAHLEGLGSIEAVAKAKEEIYTSSNSQLQSAIFNLDNQWTALMLEKALNKGLKIFSFSESHPSAHVQLKIKSMDLDQMQIEGRILEMRGECTISVFGKQNITNLMFAACVGLAVGLSPSEIWAALPQCRTTWGRNQKISDPKTGADFIFDGYNANPDSQKALVENLKLLPRKRPLIGIFGEMKELGPEAPLLHQELGQLVSGVDFDQVFFIGNHGSSFKEGYGAHKNPLQVYNEITPHFIESLKGALKEKPLVTIKGSRGVRLERILKELGLLSSEK